MDTNLNSELHQRYLQDQTLHYSSRLNEFGSSPQADSWTSKEMSEYYYSKASRVFQDYTDHNFFNENNKLKLLDIGSGNGFYAKYLQDQKLLPKIDYTGIEINRSSHEESINKNLAASFLHGDFTQMNYDFKSFHFITIIGTFSIFDSLSVSETQAYILNSVKKAFNCCEYGLALLISRFVLEDESINKFFNSLSNISSNIVLDNSLFGNYLAVHLYQRKHLFEHYNLYKSS